MDLTSLINIYRGPLIGLIASWGVSIGDATDIAQDSFSEAWLNRAACRGDWSDPEFFGRWLRGVALNQFRNWRRSRKRRERIVKPVATLDDHPVAPTEVVSSEQLDALRRAIDRLPAVQRQVILMHYLEETSIGRIATLLAVSAKTVEGRLYRARRTLHQLLQNPPSASKIGKVLRCL
ncbi:MAG: polymerase sigma factor, sigma-70 family [Planctomycetaceae bacterium]|nr:polymerase sigma factor, sigma-70 family [Planctomycetaceae bacterium]